MGPNRTPKRSFVEPTTYAGPGSFQSYLLDPSAPSDDAILSGMITLSLEDRTYEPRELPVLALKTMNPATMRILLTYDLGKYENTAELQALIAAIQSIDLAGVNAALAAGANPRADFDFPIYAACLNQPEGSVDIVVRLLDAAFPDELHIPQTGAYLMACVADPKFLPKWRGETLAGFVENQNPELNVPVDVANNMALRLLLRHRSVTGRLDIPAIITVIQLGAPVNAAAWAQFSRTLQTPGEPNNARYVTRVLEAADNVLEEFGTLSLGSGRVDEAGEVSPDERGSTTDLDEGGPAGGFGTTPEDLPPTLVLSQYQQ